MVGTVVTAIAATVGAGLVGAMLAAVRKLVRGWGNFQDDWNGQEARKGVPRRPGVMERMQTYDEKLDLLADRVGRIEQSLGGSVIVPTPVANGVTVTTQIGEKRP